MRKQNEFLLSTCMYPIIVVIVVVIGHCEFPLRGRFTIRVTQRLETQQSFYVMSVVARKVIFVNSNETRKHPSRMRTDCGSGLYSGGEVGYTSQIPSP